MPQINSPTPDATTTTKGKIQLAGDLAGTAASPTVVKAATLGYAQITANFSTTSATAVQVTSLTSTVTIPTLVGNQRVEIEFYTRDAFTAGGGIMDVTLWDGTVGSGTLLQMAEPNVVNGFATPVCMKWYGTNANISAGSHTLNIGLHRTGGTQAYIEAGATYPSFIIVKVI